MSDPAIEVKDLTKIFRLYPNLVTSRLKQTALFWNTYFREKVALENINLTVNKGEIVGVLGANGAGKTTLLKIIAGISKPTSGEVKCNGRVVAVLALGLGFHPRLTGLQNIELGGMMLGMSRKEIRARRDWIIDFSELGKDIESPMTSYSTGMRARLSFAVAACQDPEILIIDEALATGDVRFVQKCIERIHQITSSGATALFVSHSAWSMKRMTNRCIVIESGRIVDDGDTARVADRYQENMLRSDPVEKRATSPPESFVGTGEVKLRRAALRDATGRDADILECGASATMLLELASVDRPREVGLSLALRRADGISATALAGMAGGALTERHEFAQSVVKVACAATTVQIDLRPLLLAPGDFSVDLQLFDPASHSGFTSNQQYYFKTRVLEFSVRRASNPNRSIVFYQPATVTTGDWSEPHAS